MSADAKAWLSRGFWLRQEKERIEQMRCELMERLTNCTQELTGMNASGTKDPHKFDAVIDLDLALAEKEAEIDRARLEIYTAIRSVKETRFRVILMARYCECMSWPEIQAIMHYSERRVYQLHGLALQQIAPIIDEKNRLSN